MASTYARGVSERIARRNALLIAVVALATLAAAWVMPDLQLPPRLRLFGFEAVQFLVLLVPPLLLARFVLGIEFADLGLTLGEPRRWLRDVGWLALAAVPVLFALSRVPAIRAYYPVYSFARDEPWLLVPVALGFGAYAVAWEFLFRGFLQLGTRPALGRVSVLVQLVPFLVAHAGKPGAEIALTVVSGMVLGVLAHKHHSIAPGWLLHVGCSTMLNVFCVLT